MKKIILTTIVMAVMSAVALPAMAAPHDKHHPKAPHHKQHQFDHKKSNKHHPHVQANKRPVKYQHVQPHRDWRKGQVLHRNYRGKTHWVPVHSQRHLPKAGKNQRWVVVNNDYILVNTLSHVILSVLRG